MIKEDKVVKYILMAIIISTSICLIYVGIKTYAVTQIEITDVSYKQINEFDMEGFTLDLEANVYNPTMFSVYVEKVEYEIILEETGEVLTTGESKIGVLNPKEKRKINATKRINWQPTIDMALSLITAEKTNIIINGKINGQFLLYETKVPITAKIDIQPYVKQFAKQNTEEVLGEYSGVVEMAKQIAGNLLS